MKFVFPDPELVLRDSFGRCFLQPVFSARGERPSPPHGLTYLVLEVYKAYSSFSCTPGSALTDWADEFDFVEAATEANEDCDV